MRGEPGWYECVSRKRRDQQREGGTACCSRRRRHCGTFSRYDVVTGTRTRQREGVEGRGNERQQRGINQIGALPAERLQQRVRHGPADRGGKATREREDGNRLARL